MAWAHDGAERGDVSLAAGAALLMLLAASIPVSAAGALVRVYKEELEQPVLIRSLLYLMFSVAAVYSVAAAGFIVTALAAIAALGWNIGSFWLQ